MQEDWLTSALKFIRLHLALILVALGFCVVVIWGLYRVTHAFLTIDSTEPTPAVTQTTPQPTASAAAELFTIQPSTPVPTALPTAKPQTTPPATPTPAVATPQPTALPTPAPSITAESPVTAIPPSAQRYIVKPGDSTSKLAKEFLGNGKLYPQLEKANHLQHNQRLAVGQTLTIPEGKTQPRKEIKGEITSGTSVEIINGKPVEVTPGVSVSQPGSAMHAATYTIQSGDSLWKIAGKELGNPYRWPELYRLNKKVIGKNPNLVFPGVTLQLPQS